jgi:glycosyltransferase involved in cell wall biosynthesis
VPIVERDYGLPEMVVHGETGFLAESSEEMSYWAAWLAAHPQEQSRLAAQGRQHLEETSADSEAAWAAWEEVLFG